MTCVQDLCTREAITGFPSVRIYRNGSDEYQEGAFKRHEQYRGDRTVEALTAFIDGLVPSAGPPPEQRVRPSLRPLMVAAHAHYLWPR